MAVGCQSMVEAEVSGAMYTYAPLPQEKEAMVISAAWGLGPAVVDGIAESDTFILDRLPPHARPFGRDRAQGQQNGQLNRTAARPGLTLRQTCRTRPACRRNISRGWPRRP